MAKLITFYIPEGFKPRVNWAVQTEVGKVLDSKTLLIRFSGNQRRQVMLLSSTSIHQDLGTERCNTARLIQHTKNATVLDTVPSKKKNL